jgi:hypothetical protein
VADADGAGVDAGVEAVADAESVGAGVDGAGLGVGEVVDAVGLGVGDAVETVGLGDGEAAAVVDGAGSGADEVVVGEVVTGCGDDGDEDGTVFALVGGGPEVGWTEDDVGDAEG